MTKDLTTGSPIKLILGFAFPTLLGLLFQQLYSMVDTIIVGKLLGTQALAAVGTTASLFFMVLGFVIGVCNGFAIPVAQRMGAGQVGLMRRYVVNAGYLAALFAVVLTAFVTFFCRDILVAMNTPSDIFEPAYHYSLVVFFGIPAAFFYNLLSGVIRSLGDSKTPVYFLALSSILNIILDYVLIQFTPIGVVGAAVATVVSQGVSGVACLFYIKKKCTILHPDASEIHFDPEICKVLLFIGLPMGLQYSITAVGNIILATAVNGLGSMAVGAIAAGQKLSLLFWAPLEALGQTMATFCGQNVGGMKIDRVRKGMATATFLGCAYSVLALFIILPFGEQMLTIFVSKEEENLTLFFEMANQFLVTSNLAMVLLALINVLRFGIQGMGFTKFAMLAGGMEMIARILLATYGVSAYGFGAACFGGPVAWFAADLFLVPATFICIRRLEKDYMTT
ncbi:MAG: MATE family efflux transporter [Eubacteriales bacterium]